MQKILLTLALIGCSTATLADFYCSGNINNRHIDDNVAINKACHMDQVTIKGNVMLYSGAQAVIKNSSIDGNLESKASFSSVVAENNRIDGNIQLEKGQKIQLINNEVNGDIQLKENRSNIVVSQNTVDGNLQCEKNSLQPTGHSNRVNGDKEDQCRRL
jgi:hypothetical protein